MHVTSLQKVETSLEPELEALLWFQTDAPPKLSHVCKLSRWWLHSVITQAMCPLMASKEGHFLMLWKGAHCTANLHLKSIRTPQHPPEAGFLQAAVAVFAPARQVSCAPRTALLSSCSHMPLPLDHPLECLSPHFAGHWWRLLAEAVASGEVAIWLVLGSSASCRRAWSAGMPRITTAWEHVGKCRLLRLQAYILPHHTAVKSPLG